MILFLCAAGIDECPSTDISEELYVQVGCMNQLDYFQDYEEGLRLAFIGTGNGFFGK